MTKFTRGKKEEKRREIGPPGNPWEQDVRWAGWASRSTWCTQILGNLGGVLQNIIWRCYARWNFGYVYAAYTYSSSLNAAKASMEGFTSVPLLSAFEARRAATAPRPTSEVSAPTVLVGS